MEVAIRLEGGLGDHILGMRFLYFIKRRYPRHKIVAYCDCGGFPSQLEAVSLSPFPDEIVPVLQDRTRVNFDTIGELDNLSASDLAKIRAADVFIDAWPGPEFMPGTTDINPGSLYIPQSAQLRVPFYRILASRPHLQVATDSREEARERIKFSNQHRYIAINFDKYDAESLRSNYHWLRPFLMELLEDPRVTILNLFSKCMDFPHLPEEMRCERREQALHTADALEEISSWHPRIVSLINDDRCPLRIKVVAAVLLMCRYFVGVDNGLKHLAWALRVPRKYFFPFPPAAYRVLRWMPDYHNLVLVGSVNATWLIGRIRRHLA